MKQKFEQGDRVVRVYFRSELGTVHGIYYGKHRHDEIRYHIKWDNLGVSSHPESWLMAETERDHKNFRDKVNDRIG